MKCEHANRDSLRMSNGNMDVRCVDCGDGWIGTRGCEHSHVTAPAMFDGSVMAERCNGCGGIRRFGSSEFERFSIPFEESPRVSVCKHGRTVMNRGGDGWTYLNCADCGVWLDSTTPISNKLIHDIDLALSVYPVGEDRGAAQALRRRLAREMNDD